MEFIGVGALACSIISFIDAIICACYKEWLPAIFCLILADILMKVFCSTEDGL